jgi:hypothetical protein
VPFCADARSDRMRNDSSMVFFRFLLAIICL